MDKDVLKRELMRRAEQAVQEAMRSVQNAPDGQWIAASEWRVREVFQELTRDCYQAILQAKADDHPAADQAAFSPAGGGDAAEQGAARPARAHRRR